MTITYERVKSSEWRQGDVIWTSGIRCLVDREIVAIDKTSEWTPESWRGLTVFHTRAQVLNLDDIEAKDEWLGRFIRSDRRPGDGDVVRWTLQGNNLALWGRETPTAE